MRWIAAVLGLFLTQAAHANDWEKFYTSFGPTDGLIPASASPEIVPSTGNIDQDLETMWRRGYAAIGYTSFTTSNDKTKDASRFAKKLNARYLIVATDLESSRTASISLTTPTTTTSQTRGTASAYGNGGYANGKFRGHNTNYLTSNLIPLTGRFATLVPHDLERGIDIGPCAAFLEEIGGAQRRELFGHGSHDELVEAGAIIAGDLFHFALERGGKTQGVVAGNAHFSVSKNWAGVASVTPKRSAAIAKSRVLKVTIVRSFALIAASNTISSSTSRNWGLQRK